MYHRKCNFGITGLGTLLLTQQGKNFIMHLSSNRFYNPWFDDDDDDDDWLTDGSIQQTKREEENKDKGCNSVICLLAFRN